MGTLDPELEPNRPGTAEEWAYFGLNAGLFLTLATLVWAVLFVMSAELPYIRPGADVVTSEKFRVLATRDVFEDAKGFKVLAFGNSRTMAGVRPEVFDAAAGGHADLVNFGLPGRTEYVDILKIVLAHGARPDFIFLQIPWAPDRNGRGTWLSSLLPPDHDTIQMLLPFRALPRDLFVFLLGAKAAGGIAAEYRRAQADAGLVVRQKGWYFIKAQSHYANDSLPADYSLPNDTPEAVPGRSLDPKGREYTELLTLARDYHFRVVMIPTPYRVGEFAADASGAGGLRPVPGEPQVFRLGPEDVLFSP